LSELTSALKSLLVLSALTWSELTSDLVSMSVRTSDLTSDLVLSALTSELVSVSLWHLILDLSELVSLYLVLLSVLLSARLSVGCQLR
jgi:hypothetical protein